MNNYKISIAAFFCLLISGIFPVLAQNSSDVLVISGKDTLSGTLIHLNEEKPVPVVLIIAGSGPTDRNGNNPIAGENNSLKMLAEGLAENGIASLRYDKRGIGESASAMKSEADLTFDDIVNDAIACVEFLKKDKRFSKVMIAGHSEGSLIGMIAANKAKANGVISIAGVSTPADELIATQLKSQPQVVTDETTAIMKSLKEGKTVDKVSPYLFSLFRPSVQPYMISWFKYNPAEEIKKLDVPVMIINGTTDIQVSADEAKKLAAAKPSAKLLIVEGMNHILTLAEADQQKNFATYKDPTLPIAEPVIKEIVSFVKAGSKAKKSKK